MASISSMPLTAPHPAQALRAVALDTDNGGHHQGHPPGARKGHKKASGDEVSGKPAAAAAPASYATATLGNLLDTRA